MAGEGGPEKLEFEIGGFVRVKDNFPKQAPSEGPFPGLTKPLPDPRPGEIYVVKNISGRRGKRIIYLDRGGEGGGYPVNEKFLEPTAKPGGEQK